ncbi:response regulator [Pedobacter sp. SYSU D00535]|uniref:response regulator n=1 Tax=Pedobacter sp. SYSU D00535 TaxID=2810308 RepID=UPI001A95A6AD|nr:response regulator [Pedobacter sp. SYSU D00535]
MCKVLIIDDDPFYHQVTKAFIKKYDSVDEHTSYTNPVNSLLDLTEAYFASKPLPDIILLDLNMPELSGWEFLDTFSTISALTDQRTKVYIVSSSVGQDDKDRALNYPCVKGIYSKPVSNAVFDSILVG